MQQVLTDKRRRRREVAALPFPEKVKIVERMREDLTPLRASTMPLARRPATFRKP